MTPKNTTPPVVTHEPGHPDAWHCSCGNEAHTGGFDTCNKDGVIVEPAEPEWNDGLYKCGKCGLVFHPDDVQHSVPAHTAGPWHTDWLDNGHGWILDEHGNYLAEIPTKDECGFVVPPDQQRANADLMAAAPELLDCCKMLLEVLARDCNEDDDSFGSEISHAEGVIAKAEGC